MKLFQKPSQNVKSRIAKAYFDIDDLLSQDSLEEYFDYYEDELKLLRIGTSPSTWQAGHLAADSHEDIIEIVQVLKKKRLQPRSVIEQHLSAKFASAEPETISRSLDLALRLWLLINARDIQFRSLRPLSSCVQWRGDTILDTFVEDLFPSSRWSVSAKDSRLDVHFTAVMMVDVCGIHIHWTSTLQDHLLLDRRSRILSVFGYKSVLNALAAGNTESPIPCSVVQETIQTLNLLFPAWDRRTEHFLLKEGKRLHDFGSFPASRNLNLLDFDHWRDRLIELYEEVYKAPPVTWAQLWRDRRNPHLFYTFWIAFAILVLTVAQFVTGVIQAWASLRALRRD